MKTAGELQSPVLSFSSDLIRIFLQIHLIFANVFQWVTTFFMFQLTNFNEYFFMIGTDKFDL
jgi:hypothetical protein